MILTASGRSRDPFKGSAPRSRMHSGYQQLGGGGELPAIEVRSHSESRQRQGGSGGLSVAGSPVPSTARVEDRATSRWQSAYLASSRAVFHSRTASGQGNGNHLAMPGRPDSQLQLPRLLGRGLHERTGSYVTRWGARKVSGHYSPRPLLAGTRAASRRNAERRTPAMPIT